MDERIKYGLQIVALITAAFVGYSISQVSVIKLQEKVTETTLKLGAVEQQIKELEQQTVTMKQNMFAAQEVVKIIISGNLPQASEFLKAVDKNKDLVSLAIELQNLKSRMDTLSSELISGSLVVKKAEMLQARDADHWLRYRRVDGANHDVFELWRTDNTWHSTIRVEAAGKLLARDEGHWLKFNQVTPQNNDYFQLWRIDNTWHPTIKVTAAAGIN